MKNDKVENVISKILSFFMRFSYRTTRWTVIGDEIPSRYHEEQKPFLVGSLRLALEKSAARFGVKSSGRKAYRESRQKFRNARGIWFDRKWSGGNKAVNRIDSRRKVCRGNSGWSSRSAPQIGSGSRSDFSINKSRHPSLQFLRKKIFSIRFVGQIYSRLAVQPRSNGLGRSD